MNLIQKPEIIFIDFDGVISKSSVQENIKNLYSFINQYTPIPYKMILDFFKNVMCFSINQTLQYLFSSLGIGDKLSELYQEDIIQKFYDTSQIEVECDFYHFLDFCKQNSIRYIIYSSRDQEVKKLSDLNGLSEDNIYDLRGRSKADYQTFTEAANDLGIDLPKCMYIDDTPLALRTGKLHGMNTVMMLNEVFTEEDYHIFSSYIDYKINSFSELTAIITKVI